MKPILNEDGEPERCDECGAMLATYPSEYLNRPPGVYEGGPICRRCQRIGASMAEAATRHFEAGRGIMAWAGDETYGDRRYEIIHGDDD